MVRIVDGEILQDDDPRLKQPRAQPQAQPSASAEHRPVAGGAGARGGSVFDWSQPAFRLAQDEADQAGIPGVVLYGAHVKGTHLLALAAAGLFMGLKGVVIGAGVWFFWKNSQAGQAAGQPQAAAGQRADNAQRAQAFFSSMMGGQQGSSAGNGGGPVGGNRPGGGSRPQPADPWAGKGKGHKLGGS